MKNTKRHTIKELGLQPANGFSLHELLTVMSIFAILTAIAIPNIIQALPNYRLKSAARSAVADFTRAKQEAVKRNKNMAVVFLQPFSTSSFDYLIFEDSDADLEFDPGELLFRKVFFQNYGKVQMDIARNTFARNDDNLKSFAFNPRALPISNSGGMGMGSFVLENSNGLQARVIMSGMGRLRIEMGHKNTD